MPAKLLRADIELQLRHGDHAYYFMPAKVVLQVASGPLSGQRFEFDRHDTFLFGRSVDCHAKLPKDDQLASRHHFILEVNPPDACIRDLGSLNGTVINGVKHGGREPHESPQQASTRTYPQIDLKNGDEVTVGNTRITVTVEVPSYCGECQAELVAGDSEPLCATCRNRTAQRPAAAIAEKPHCERCGKDVSAEVQNGRRGDYVCRDCQSEALTEDGGLRKLLLDAARKSRDQAELKIDGYEVGKELGRGSMGVVYQARRKDGGEIVAVKVLLAKVAVSKAAKNRFLREIDSLERLRHPHIVPLLEHGAAGSAFYFVMEFCSGGTLAQLAQQRGGTLPLEVASPIMIQCLRGLDHAHTQKIVHRDLKPENVLIESRAGGVLAKLSDFGLAKDFERAGLSGMTATGSFGGTYPFMPREQLTDYKHVLPVSDVWSMAATFYSVLSGKFPLSFTEGRDPVEVILRDDAVPIRNHQSRIPQAVAAVIDHALAMDPRQRCQSAAEFLSGLQNSLG